MRNDARLTATALAAVLACSPTDVDPADFALPPGASPPIATDATVYTLTKVPGGYDAEAQAVYTNSTGRTVFYRRCHPESTGPIHGVRRTGPDSAASSIVGAFWTCVGGVPTGRVRPGGRLSAHVWLGSTDSPESQPPITPSMRVGQFRIVFALCAEYAGDSDGCEPLPLAASESDAFEVRFPTP
jgi:hypothetical protein